MRKIIYTCLTFVISSTLLCGQTYEKGSFTDSRDGQTYRTIRIENQVWMAQNLNYITEKESWLMQGDSAGMQFGRFYTWAAAKEAVPSGWHLPSKQELKILATNLGVNHLPNRDDLYSLLIEGGASGFNIQLTGSYNEAYGKPGKSASFWSSEECWQSRIMPFSEAPWRLSVHAPNYINIGRGAESFYGFNVRCIRDQ